MNIGDKILCINGSGWRDYINRKRKYMGIILPKAGEVYIIRGLPIDGGLILEEIVNGLYPYMYNGNVVYVEPSFLKSRFMKWNPEEEVIEEKNYSEIKNVR